MAPAPVKCSVEGCDFFKQDRDNTLEAKCFNCGGSKHGTGSPEDRAKSCPTFGRTCTSQRKNHLVAVCKSKTKVATLQEDKSDIVKASLSFFSIQAEEEFPVITNTTQLAGLVPSITR